MGMKKKSLMTFEDVSLILETEKNLSTGDIIRNIFNFNIKKKVSQTNTRNTLLDAISFEAFEGDVTLSPNIIKN